MQNAFVQYVCSIKSEVNSIRIVRSSYYRLTVTKAEPVQTFDSKLTFHINEVYGILYTVLFYSVPIEGSRSSIPYVEMRNTYYTV